MTDDAISMVEDLMARIEQENENRHTWHIRHADGSEWTLTELVERYGRNLPRFLIDGSGRLFVMQETRNGSWKIVDKSDMEVVWDE